MRQRGKKKNRHRTTIPNKRESGTEKNREKRTKNKEEREHNT